VDQELIATVEAKDHDLKKAASRVEPEAQLSCWTVLVLVLVQVADEDGMLGGMDGVIRIDSVLTRGVVHLHAT